MEIDTNIYLGPGDAAVGKDSSKYIDKDFSRQGQDIRYSINDSKLKKLGWNNECDFYEELPHIVKYYKENFVW